MTNARYSARSVIAGSTRVARRAGGSAGHRAPPITHTVELFDYGFAADGAFYFVMELLEGLDADALVRRHGPLPSERAGT